jgi:hypothetical protein
MVDFSSALLSSVGCACVGLAALPLLVDVESAGLMLASDGGNAFGEAATDWLDELAELSDTGLGRSVFDVFWQPAKASASIAQATRAPLFLGFIHTSQETP